MLTLVEQGESLLELWRISQLPTQRCTTAIPIVSALLDSPIFSSFTPMPAMAFMGCEWPQRTAMDHTQRSALYDLIPPALP